MTYTLLFKVTWPDTPTRSQTTTIAGCADENAAKAKLQTFYPGAKLQITKITPVVLKG